MQGGTTQAEEEVRFRMKVWSGEHMGPFGSGEEKGPSCHQGRRGERSAALTEQGGAEGVEGGEGWKPALRKFLVV